MRKETAEAIVEAAEAIGLDVDHREDYSGRGMYGKSCSAIVCDFNDILQAVAQAAVDLDGAGDQGELDEFMEDLGNLRSDSMGRGTVYY